MTGLSADELARGETMREDDQQLQQLRRFLRPLSAMALAFGVLYVTAAVVTASPPLAVLGSALLLYTGATLRAHRLAEASRAADAASLVAYGALAFVLLAGLVLPSFYPALTIGGLVAVAMALPHVAGAKLRLLLGASYAALVLVTVHGFRPDPTTALPPVVQFVSIVGATAAAGYLLMLLLWQFTRVARETLDATRAAREAAEVARQRSAFLAEASRVLAASSLDYRATLSAVAWLAVPTLADYCIVDELTEDGVLQRVEAAHVDRTRQPILDRLRRIYVRTGDHPAVQVLQTLEPVLIPVVDDDRLAKVAQSPEHLEILRELAPTSTIVVPLVARGRALGSILLARAKPSRPYERDDLALAVELANRAALACDNARLYVEAQAAVRVRDEFLSIASHELKTPLTALELQIEMMRRRREAGREAPLPEWIGKRIDSIARQNDRLVRLVDELLDLSRIVGGRLKLTLEPVDLVEVLRDVCDRFQDPSNPAAASSSIRLDVAGPIVGRWDRLRLEQIVTNLLSNAVKYGAGSAIEIMAAADSETATLKVLDHGIGIAPADQQRIFDRFERAVSANHFGGFGVGLFIARQFTEALGGTIGVSSELGSGATFTVRLPLPGPASASMAAASPHPPTA